MRVNPLVWLVLCSWLAPAALVGCGEPAPVTIAARQDAIRGGRAAPDLEGVVGIVLQLGDAGGICSGSLIAPNLVLTAQHCVAEIASPEVTCGRTPFGQVFPPSALFVTPDPVMQQEGSWYAVREVHVAAQGADTCGHDLAVLILDQPLRGMALREPRLDAYPAVGERFTAAGYGHVGDDTGAGVRRLIEGREWLCAGPSCAAVEGVTGTELVGNDGTCQGDSGGPALDAQGRVLGALSRGGEQCSYPTYAAVAGWADWVRAMGVRAAEVGALDPEPWTGAPPRDSDGDGWSDREDNCPDTANADQGDLDDDGLGDACDPQQDRDCAVCVACALDADCGPGAVCGPGGRCLLACRAAADCPGGATTTCAVRAGASVCVNADYEAAGECAAGFVCGVSLATPEPEPEPEPEPAPEPAPEPGVEPAPGDLVGVALPQPNERVQVLTPTRLEGGCAATGDGPGSTGALALLWLGLLGLRRRRRGPGLDPRGGLWQSARPFTAAPDRSPHEP